MPDNNQAEVKLTEDMGGTVSFATDVIATIAGLAVSEIEGVAEVTKAGTSFFDSFGKRANKKEYTKGTKVEVNGNSVKVSVSIIIEYGYTVPSVARNLQENVKKAIETMTGLDCESVDIHVMGISFEKENKEAAELSEMQRKLIETAEETAEADTQEAETEETDGVDETEVSDADYDAEELPDEEDDFELDLPEEDEEEDQ